MTDFVLFGTELEELDDEHNDGISRRPLGVQEQTVCDERGRRRFHGAFTGGFSAGFFNTVGSKQVNEWYYMESLSGWQPKQFRSSRGERADRYEQTAEDFMDDEDLGEFGIATRRVHTALDDAVTRGDHKRSQSALESSLAGTVEALVRPVRESMGVRLLKKMGWRQGQGIGPKMSRRALEKHKQNEDRARGLGGRGVDEDWVKEVEEMAPGFEFGPEDVLCHYLQSRDGWRGLGYEGLARSSVLSQRYGSREAALKTSRKSKGIQGQAFGVGAFEDDDDNIYTSTDLSQYDFSIGGDDAPSTSRQSYDTTFVMAEKRQGARPVFEPPRLPPSFRPLHRPILLDVSLLPEAIRKLGQAMNHVQRAKFLGEVDKNAVMELIRDEDRKRLAGAGEQKTDGLERMFEDEPMKQARFKQYILYLKRGLSLPPPVEMTSLEWERELSEFQRVLPPHLRSLLPEVRARQAPLANKDLAVPIAMILKSKFAPSTGGSHRKSEVKDEDRLTAVRMKMFGERTRVTHEWHPSKQVAKRFNVPHPFPGSALTGVKHLQKTTKRENLLNLGSTAEEVQYRAGNNEPPRTAKGTDDAAAPHAQDKSVKEGNEDKTKEERAVEKPPVDLIKAIFADSDDEESDDNEEGSGEGEGEGSDGSVNEGPSEKVPEDSGPSEKVPEGSGRPDQPTIKFVTVMDLVQSDDEQFGPAPPPQSSNQPEPASPPHSVVRRHREEKERKHKKKKKEKHRKDSKKKSDHKKHKKERRRRSTSSSVVSTD